MALHPPLRPLMAPRLKLQAEMLFELLLYLADALETGRFAARCS